MSMAEPTPHEQVMDGLLQAQKLAARLPSLVRDSPEAGLIVDQMLHIFSRAIKAGAGEGSEAQSEVTCGGKRKAAAAPGGERRGTGRSRTMQSSGATKVVKSIEDGQAWRKYGQKDIHNSNHPKSYFRCTHKYDQNCPALRQVQRCDADPDSFMVTYIGAHTCRDKHHAGSQLLCFATMKQEGGEQEEVRSCLTPGSSAGAWPDLGDVTSAPQFYGDGADFGEFFGLEDIIKLCE